MSSAVLLEQRRGAYSSSVGGVGVVEDNNFLLRSHHELRNALVSVGLLITGTKRKKELSLDY